MKKLLLAFIALALPALAQNFQTATVSPEYPWRLQVDLTFSSGQLSAAPVMQYYRSDVTDGSGNLITHSKSNPEILTVDLVAAGAKTVTVNGTSYTYAQAIQILQAIMAQERAAQLAPPPPPSS